MVYKITLTNGEVWFDDCSTSLDEAIADAKATFGEQLVSVVEC